MYEFDAPGTERASTEYVVHDDDIPVEEPDTMAVHSAPVLVGDEALAVSPRWSSRLVDKPHVVEAPKAPRRRAAP